MSISESLVYEKRVNSIQQIIREQRVGGGRISLSKLEFLVAWMMAPTIVCAFVLSFDYIEAGRVESWPLQRLLV